MVWIDVILADFQRVISRYMQNSSTNRSYIAQTLLRTTFIQTSKSKYVCLTSKIFEVWIDWFCVRYDWWCRLQPTSSVSPVCAVEIVLFHHKSQYWTYVFPNAYTVNQNSDHTDVCKIAASMVNGKIKTLRLEKMDAIVIATFKWLFSGHDFKNLFPLEYLFNFTSPYIS